MEQRLPHKPTPDSRKLVQLHTAVGTDQNTIARILDVDPKTLRKHYRDELDLGLAKANAQVGGKLFNKAIGGDTASMIFWMKTRAGWREVQRIEGPGENGEHLVQASLDVSKLSTEALAEIVAAADAAKPG